MEKGKVIVSIDWGGRYTLHLKPLPEGTEVLKEKDFVETFVKKYGENVDVGEKFYGEVSEETLKKLITVYIPTTHGYFVADDKKFVVTFTPGEGLENHRYYTDEEILEDYDFRDYDFEDENFEHVSEEAFLKRIGAGEKVALIAEVSREAIYHMACMGYYGDTLN